MGRRCVEDGERNTGPGFVLKGTYRRENLEEDWRSCLESLLDVAWSICSVARHGEMLLEGQRKLCKV